MQQDSWCEHDATNDRSDLNPIGNLFSLSRQEEDENLTQQRRRATDELWITLQTLGGALSYYVLLVTCFFSASWPEPGLDLDQISDTN